MSSVERGWFVWLRSVQDDVVAKVNRAGNSSIQDPYVRLVSPNVEG